MAFSYSRLGSAILGFSLAVFAAGSFDASAQEAAAVPANIGACPNNNDAAFADPMNKPHWNGWGVEPTQHRFQPRDMARLDPSDAARLKLKWAFGFPGATRSVAQPTDLRRARVCRQPERKALLARREDRMRVLGLRRGRPYPLGRRHRPARGRLDGIFRRSRRERPCGRRADRQVALDRQNRRPSGGDDHRLADVGRNNAIRASLIEFGARSAIHCIAAAPFEAASSPWTRASGKTMWKAYSNRARS